ncbi:little elongation complex subunit 2 isoform X3 [Perognathus longimembris pacificus]|uniref:little elongation complex subunit 2 isoform X3 n=1 Tax=Perognathus longimembris pacificus TaxID=214514 RepID=UPI0020185F16|nr:little elongation complex subunit 2 isoform X3 [Perognathus longimembris pacificus]
MNSSMSMGEPRLNWDISPKNGLKTFFSQENYKDHSLAPSLKELFTLSNRRIGENLNASANSVENEPTVSSAPQTKEKVGMVLLPKPRVPYPRFSRFSQREQRTYVDLLVKYAKIPANSKAVGINRSEYLQYLDMKKHVNEEVTEFLKFLQNSAKKCAQDYNMLSDDARLFTEQILRACIEQIKKYPEFFSLHEVTSLMGFFPFRTEMGLKLEKTLLVLGNVKFVKTVFPSMPAKLYLSKDAMSSTEIPKEIAEALHSDISKDPNAEKLVSRYHPQIALTSQSLFTLLNNHGPNYKEQWEIPVCVQLVPVAGSKPVKVIYINSPLPPKQMTMRERNQIFHEVPLKCMMSKNTSVPVSAVFMDKPEESVPEMDTSSEVNECRKIETHENLDLNFDEDVTELETFGVTTTKPPKSPNPASTSSESIMTDTPVAAKAAPPAPPPMALATPDIATSSRSLAQMLMEQLKKEKQLVTGQASVGNHTTSNPEDSCVLKKPIKRVYKKFDPVGEILKMQDELLKPISRKVPESNLMNTDDSKQSLVSEQSSAPSDASGWPKSGWPSAFQKPKGRLPYELQDYVEDTSEYLPPKEGNFVYKLFSLQDLLLLVRCSIQKIETRPRSKKKKKIRRQFPVYVLPKLEYQGCYGVEALTESELCRLWTESLLHSNCSFYVGHIDAFTSKLFLLEEITSEELKEKLSALKISSLFNILQHILKKLSSLQEGCYLLSHAAEDSSLLIYKTSDGKVSRTAYNLHKSHCDLPSVPSSLSVPWVPLDPSLLLPYHIHHGRIPCTFPPKSQGPATQLKAGGPRMLAHSRRNPVPMETKSSCLPAQQVGNEGVAQNKRKLT